MKNHRADDEDLIRALLDYLNHCHDGSLRRISFVKNRELTENGNLVLFSSETLHKGDCDIEAELFLNSYIGASPTQVVILNFQDVRSFRFYQDNDFDYSDIYEVSFCRVDKYTFEFSFRATQQKIEALTVVCRKLVCREL